MPDSDAIIERICSDVDLLHELAVSLGLETVGMLLAMVRLELKLIRHEITDAEFEALRQARCNPPVSH